MASKLVWINTAVCEWVREKSRQAKREKKGQGNRERRKDGEETNQTAVILLQFAFA